MRRQLAEHQKSWSIGAFDNFVHLSTRLPTERAYRVSPGLAFAALALLPLSAFTVTVARLLP